jgi:hypothetical protein
MATLTDVFDDIARTLASHAGQRCPYRTASDACTFHGGCRNQHRAQHAADPVACGGDGNLQWTSALESHASSWPRAQRSPEAGRQTGCLMPEAGGL